MIDHFGWFHHFLKPIHHFTGASFFRVKLLLFGSPSFYRNIILLEQLCPPNSSPSFYELTLKKFNGVHHFTGSLLLHWNYRNQQIFSHKTRWRRTERALSVGKQYYLHYVIFATPKRSKFGAPKNTKIKHLPVIEGWGCPSLRRARH